MNYLQFFHLAIVPENIAKEIINLGNTQHPPNVFEYLIYHLILFYKYFLRKS